MKNKITKVQKRDGSIVEFDQTPISDAIFKALTATGQGDGKRTKKLSDKVVQILNRRFKTGEIPQVEQIQDIVEEVLILEGLVKTAKAYILYREQRRKIREAVKVSEEAVERIDQYLEKLDWEVQENANMAFSLQGLNHYGVSYIVKNYWLNKIYPKEIREANESGDFHIHNLDTLGPYCAGWDLYDLLLKGFGGVPGKVESKPAKHFRSALGQVVNFIFTIQGEVAGAVAFSNFDTLLAPFITYDNLNYQQVKQALQEFMFNMSVPTRTGFQSPFSNLTLDLKPSSVFAKQPVIIAGQPQDKTYEEFQPEMDMFNRVFYEVMLEGDKNQRVFSVDGDCLCPIKNSEKIKLVKIGEYIDRIMKEQKPAFIKENNCQLVDVRDSNIKCLGLKNGRLNWQKVNFLIRHPLDNLLKIWTTGGFNIKVTPSHSVLALKDGKIESFEASKLKVGDRLISPKIIPLGKNKISEISLAEEFIKKRKEQGIYISNTLKKGKPYQEKRTAIHKRNYGKRTYKYFYGVSVFPLKNIKKDLNKFNFSRAKINLAGSSLKINNSLPITNELIEFLGWYCAEGSAEKNKKCGGISLGFNLIKEKHLPYHIGDLIKKIWPNVQFTFRKIKKRNLTEIRIHSKLLRRIVTEIFEIGNKVGKKVPQIIFEIPPEKKKIFLKAYFAGDAWLTKNIVVNSISRELIYGVSTLLKQLDIFHTITEYYWKGRARWRIIIWRNRKLKPKSSYTISKIPIKESGIERISEKILEKESYYYDSLGRKRRNTIARIFKKFTNSSANFFSTSLQNVKNIIHYAEKLKIEIPPVLKEIEKGELLFFKIKKIEKAFSSNRMAYDFSTGSENFVADQFLVHNTFPIPTINITKDFNWDNPALEPMWQATAKYGVNYFSNYINSDMKPEDVKSMCCRLRLDLTELHNRGGGGLFGSGSLTGCYDEKTEILTEDSWKSFKDLTKEDRVFTLDDNNKIELHKPKRLFEYDYQGKMVHFKGRSFDLLVTPNHKMVVDHKGSMKRMFVEAKDFKPYQHYIPKEGTWGGEEREHFVLPPVLIMGGAGPESRFSERQLGTIRQLRKEGNSIYQLAEDFNCNSVTVHNICTKESYGNRGRLRLRYEAPPLKIKMDDWLKFFGFWTAEGCTDNDKIALDHGYRVVISQVNKQKREEIRKVLDSLPFNYYLGGENNFVICNKQLWSYLRQFGNKYEKFIPKEIRSLSKRQLKILFDWLVKGDGHIRKTTGQINYWTASKKLADDLQEIILKLGWLGTLARQKSKVSQIKGRKVKSGIIYTLGAQKTKHYGFGKKEKIKERIREVNYKGKIYCCEVENHTVFVRRNGKVTWSGNSIGVVTIDLPRIGYLSKTKKEFFERLAKSMDLAKESLEIKRKTIENFIEKGLYPYSKFYLSEIKKARGAYYANHFSTIGLLGMNEALLNFLGENIASLKGQKFTLEVLDFMRERLVKYQEETGNLYNLEQTPAESTSFRLALKDKEKYPEIITAGTKETPFYTNSSQLPVNYTDDVFEALKLQDEITCKYTGGSVFHIFLGEKIFDIQSVKNLVKKVFENFHLPYITITPTFSICPSHGYLSGEHFFCPKCVIKQPCEVYTRVVGYIRLVSQWNVGKQQEFKERKTFKFSKSET